MHEVGGSPTRSFICFGPLSNSPKNHCVSPQLLLSIPSYDTHILGPMSEITHVFDQLLTQLALVGLGVKMSKCKLWNPSKIFLDIEILQGYTLIIDGLCILCVPRGSQDFAMHFLDEVLSQDMAHIDDLPFLGNVLVALGILFTCIAC